MERETRYIVLKQKDVEKHLTGQQHKELGHICHSINCGRKNEGKQAIECVVVESDWPEYEPTWAAIERRVDSTNNFASSVLREVEISLSPDKPLGFMAVAMSYSEPLGRVVPTIIDMRESADRKVHSQELIHQKLIELGELLRSAYS